MSEVARERLRLWRHEPWTMSYDLWKTKFDWWQMRFARKFADPHSNRLGAVACKGPGKTFLLAQLSWNFLLTRPRPKCVATSITKDNLRDNYWTEMAFWRERAPVLDKMFEQTKTEIFHKQYPKTWRLSARAWPRDADPDQQADALAGIHADYVLAILDEMGGIPPPVAAAAEGVLATGKEVKIIGGGNPTDRDGLLYLAKHSPTWWTVDLTGDPRIQCSRDPKCDGCEVCGRASRVRRKWAFEQIELWGLDSPYVQVNVLGRFPDVGTDTVIPLALFEEAINRYHEPENVPTGPLVLSLDVARFGSDNSVATVRRGGFLERQITWSGQATTKSAARMRDLRKEAEDEFGMRCEGIAVDDIGVGGGVTDTLEDMGETVIPVDIADKEHLEDDQTYEDLKSELCFSLRFNWFKRKRFAINPEAATDELKHEATTIKYDYTGGNKIKVESKKDYRKRNRGRSPDRWDSLMLSEAIADEEGSGGFASSADDGDRFASDILHGAL